MTVPVDDAALDAIEHAMGGAWSYETGEPVFVGADYTMSQLLDFWAGPTNRTLITHTDDGTPVYELSEPRVSERDLIAALITEIRRLRGKVKVG